MIPKIELRATNGVTVAIQLAAIRGEPLFCIVKRATPHYLETLETLIRGLPAGVTHPMDDVLRAVMTYSKDWHIDPVSGEYLTRRAAVKNAILANMSGDWEAGVHEYTAAECLIAALRE